MSGWRDMVAHALAGDQGPETADEEPPALARGLTELRRMPTPRMARAERWQQILGDAAALLADWEGQLTELGWTLGDVFGLDLSDVYGESDGLVFTMRGGRVALIDAGSAIIRDPDGHTTRIHYRRPTPAEPAWIGGRSA